MSTMMPLPSDCASMPYARFGSQPPSPFGFGTHLPLWQTASAVHVHPAPYPLIRSKQVLLVVPGSLHTCARHQGGGTSAVFVITFPRTTFVFASAPRICQRLTADVHP